MMDLKSKKKMSEKYLGDTVDCRGLSASIEATISERFGRIYSSILEVKTILEDYRSSKARGVTAGIRLWEMAIIPSLLNNSESWVDLDNSVRTTPNSELLWDTGIIPMEKKM